MKYKEIDNETATVTSKLFSVFRPCRKFYGTNSYNCIGRLSRRGLAVEFYLLSTP